MTNEQFEALCGTVVMVTIIIAITIGIIYTS